MKEALSPTFLTLSLHSRFSSVGKESIFPKLPVAVHLSLNSMGHLGSLLRMSLLPPAWLQTTPSWLFTPVPPAPAVPSSPQACLCMVASVFIRRPFPQLGSLRHGLQVLLKGPLSETFQCALDPFLSLSILVPCKSCHPLTGVKYKSQRKPKLCFLRCLQ